MHLDWLLDRFSKYSNAPALISNETGITYGQLLAVINSCRGRLLDDRVEPGQVVAIEGSPCAELIALVLALIDHGAVVVPLGSAARPSRDEFCGIAQVQTSYSLLNGLPHKASHQQAVTNGLLLQLQRRKHPGLILFSSGSTGEPKAALHDLLPLLEKYKVVRRSFRTLWFLQPDHIGGFNTLLYSLANGGCLVSSSVRSPQAVCSFIETYKIELLPTTPTFLHMLLLSDCITAYDLSSLKLVTYGTEVMPASTLQKIREALPHAQTLQTYGLTEVGILRSKSREDGSLWVKVGGEGYETKIVDDTLWIRADSAMMGYLNAESPFDNEGWLNTHDAVEADGDWIRILGRSTEIINVGGEKVYPGEVENLLLEIDNIKGATVFAKPNRLLGNIVAARVQLHREEAVNCLKRRIWESWRGLVPRYKIPIDVEIVPELSVSPRYKKIRTAESV